MEYFYAFDKIAYVKGQKKISGCILCHLRDKHQEIIDLTVYTDELFIVSVNLYPYNPGHLLLFPVQHKEDIRAYTAEEEKRLNHLIKVFLNVLDELYTPFGYNLGYNMGLVAGGSIAHLHYHMIPRYPNEIGIADLLAGKRVLVENPRETQERISRCLHAEPFHTALRQK
jgi:ATP adenylyltransferase